MDTLNYCPETSLELPSGAKGEQTADSCSLEKEATMARKPIPKPDDPEQSKRFVDMAKEVGAGEDAESLDRAIKKFGSRREQHGSIDRQK